MSTADYHDFLQARLMEGIREFMKPQWTATRTSLNKKINKQNNGCARFISTPSSAGQKRENTKFCVFKSPWCCLENVYDDSWIFNFLFRIYRCVPDLVLR